jgi:hypothetical protein
MREIPCEMRDARCLVGNIQKRPPQLYIVGLVTKMRKAKAEAPREPPAPLATLLTLKMTLKKWRARLPLLLHSIGDFCANCWRGAGLANHRMLQKFAQADLVQQEGPCLRVKGSRYATSRIKHVSCSPVENSLANKVANKDMRSVQTQPPC